MNTYLERVDSFKKNKSQDSFSYQRMLRLRALYKNV